MGGVALNATVTMQHRSEGELSSCYRLKQTCGLIPVGVGGPLGVRQGVRLSVEVDLGTRRDFNQFSGLCLSLAALFLPLISK